MIKDSRDRFSTEIRNEDRKLILNERRRNFDADSSLIALMKTQERLVYQIRDLVILSSEFLTGDSLEMKAQFLVASLQFLNQEDRHQMNQLITNKPEIAIKIKECCYDENLPIQFRETCLLLLSELLNSDYEFCDFLLERKIEQCLIAFVKMQITEQMTSNAFLGIGHIVAHKVWLRNYFSDEGLETFLPLILKSCESDQSFERIAYLLNCWFRDKMQRIDIDLYCKLLAMLLEKPIQKQDYEVDVIWFAHQFIAQATQLISKDDSVRLSEKLKETPYFQAFLKSKLNPQSYMSCIAAFRMLPKLINISGYWAIEFEDYIIQALHSTSRQEINILKIEALKIAIAAAPHVQLLGRILDVITAFYSCNTKIQYMVYQFIMASDLTVLTRNQLIGIYDLCKSTLLGVMIEPHRILIALELVELLTQITEIDLIPIVHRLQEYELHESENIYKVCYRLLTLINSYE